MFRAPMRALSTAATVLLAFLVFFLYVPRLYDRIFVPEVERTHLLFSPVKKRFVYRESIVGPIPDEARAMAEDHHAEIAYRDEDGAWFSRVDFEKSLPFIYYKNMELWGLLPLTLEGRVFDRAEMKRERQVTELRSREIADAPPALHFLMDSQPDGARLVLPDDAFRMTASEMQFIGTDTNAPVPDLTRTFTGALSEAGFVFPARSVHANTSILKPVDEGFFMVDAEYSVFHVKRRRGDAVVVQTPIPRELKTRHIALSESTRGEYYGLLLDGSGALHVLLCERYRTVPLPLEGYDFRTMDFKLIVNPLYRVAVYSDEETIFGIAMTADYVPVRSFRHRMSRAEDTLAKRVSRVLFPFRFIVGTEGERASSVSLLMPWR
ncbi:DUF4857 domain-containing protein [Fretibacterium sp. OH1220_COT-178]|uniref:DUF4857 domain-containing protein n=1 Tax=Fretibacterium sp. OH1220_COT-178 TaxID=2491047 RepID=UPI0013152767|nr:DUF4857 domain-containing protein [Fretibacterium sp. OH1220_COT-178]